MTSQATRLRFVAASLPLLLPAYAIAMIPWHLETADQPSLPGYVGWLLFGLYVPVLYLLPATPYLLLLHALVGDSTVPSRVPAFACTPVMPIGFTVMGILLAAPSQGLRLPTFTPDTAVSTVAFMGVLPLTFAALVALRRHRLLRVAD